MTRDEISNIIESIHATDLTKENISELRSILSYVIQNYSQYRKDTVLVAQLLQTYLKIHVCPVVIVYWDKEKDKPMVTGASGVLLHLDEKFLVTNWHVIEEYRNKKRDNDNEHRVPIFQIGAAPINLKDNLIDENETLDLATIKLTDEILAQISDTSYKEFYQPDAWPCNMQLKSDDMITIVGFPGIYRRTESPTRTLFNYVSASLPVMDANEKTFYVEINVGQAIQIIGTEDPKHLMDSLGGFSGGGVFTSNEESLELIGFIKEDGGGFFNGIQATYSRLIRRNGSIDTQFDLYR